MYLGLLLLGVGGLWAAAIVGWLTAPWIVASYVVLAVVMVLMWSIAGSYYYALRDGLEGTGTTRASTMTSSSPGCDRPGARRSLRSSAAPGSSCSSS